MTEVHDTPTELTVETGMTTDDHVERSRSRVRVVLSYAAGLVAFGLPAAIVAAALLKVDQDVIERALYALAAGGGAAGIVIGYWFNERSHERRERQLKESI